MKTILLSTLIIGLAQLTYSQTQIAYTESTNIAENHKKEVKVSDFDLWEDLEETFMAEKTKKLLLEVLNYDIKSSSVYSPRSKTTYTVNFTEGNHHIEAIYDNNGNLLQSDGVFENVRIPYIIGSRLAKEYPGWEFHKSWCYSLYEFNRDTAVMYRIQLKKLNKTKMINVDPLDYNL